MRGEHLGLGCFNLSGLHCLLRHIAADLDAEVGTDDRSDPPKAALAIEEARPGAAIAAPPATWATAATPAPRATSLRSPATGRSCRTWCRCRWSRLDPSRLDDADVTTC